jgi:hypothetical protein
VSEKLDWVFEGVDKMTGPLGGMTTGLVKFSFGLNQAHEALSTLIEGMAKIGEMGFEAGKFALEALSFKEKTLIGYETILQSKEEAAGLFQQAVKMADFTPFSAANVAGQFSDLLSQGFEKKEVPIVFQGIADIGSMGRTEAEGQRMVDAVTMHFGRMMQNVNDDGVAMADNKDLKMMFMMMRGSGIKPNNFWENLGKDLGVSAVQAHKLVDAGLVPAKKAMEALLDTTTQLGGKAGPGFIAVKMGSQTLDGLWISLKSRAEELFLMMGGGSVDSVKGMDVLKAAMQNVADLFNNQTPRAQAFIGALEGMLGGALAGLFGGTATGMKGMEAGLDRLTAWINKQDWVGIFTTIRGVAVNTFKVLWGIFDGVTTALTPLTWMFGRFTALLGASGTGDTLKYIGWALGFVFGAAAVAAVAIAAIFFPITAATLALLGIGAAVMALMDVDWSWGAITGGLTEMVNALFSWVGHFIGLGDNLGDGMVQGLVSGIKNGAGWLWGEVTSMAAGVRDAFKKALGIHSPSTVFAELGGFTAEGFQMGVEGGTAEANAAVSKLAAPPDGAAGGGAGLAGRVEVTFGERSIVIDARGMDGEMLARKLADLLPTQIVMALEGMAMEGGAL